MSSSENPGEETRPILLRGHHVGLALMRQEDVPTIARWNQDLELGTPGEAHTIEMREEFYKQNSRLKADSVEFAVIKLHSGGLIGFSGLFDITRAMAATMFVGIGDPGERGKGYGAEASRLICEYGFFFRSLHNIKVEVHAYNQPALRTYERLGFKLVGRLRGVNLLNGLRHDEVIMDLVRDEFTPRHTSRFGGLDDLAGKPPGAA